MALYTIGDLHLSLAKNKPMDVFDPVWKNHADRIERYWKRRIREDDNPNVRSAPIVADDNKIGNVRAAEEFTILDVSDNGWYLIQLDNGKTAWVNGKMGTVVEIGFNFASDTPDAAAEGGE